MKRILLFIATIFCLNTAYASHSTGAEIWYEHDTLNTYTVHLRLYTACMGLAGPQTIDLNYRSVSLAVSPIQVAMNLDTAYNYNTCTATSCANPPASLPGFLISEYSTSVTLNGSANDWYFYVHWYSRTNSSNINGGYLYVDATLDNLNNSFNNSVPVFAPISMTQIFNGQTTLHLPMYDIDGDSVDIHFTNPLTGNALGIPSNIAFQPNFSITNPFNSTIAPVLNSSTGELTLNSGPIGGYTFAVQIDEYRNNVLIGTSKRDYVFGYSPNGTNSTPILSGVNNTTNFTTSTDDCPSSTLTFTVNSTDPDATDSTYIEAFSIPNGATFTTNTTQNQIGTFAWTPTTADVRSEPYIISFKVRDNNCAEQFFGYQVYVNNCNPDSVWAGDANADFTCDNYDVLNIGLANGSTGAVRAGATTNWQAEWCANWATTFLNNIDYKHADCNGDGTVSGLDVGAVSANYGQIHFKNSNVGQYKTLGLPDLYCDVSSVQAIKGTTVTVPVMLGTSASLMNDFYGISATVELLNAQTSAPISVSKNVSWIGNATNSFEFEKSLAPNKTAFTFVRNNQQNVNAQQGQIGEISFPIDAASVTGSKVIVQFSDIKMIKNTGEEITDYNVLQDSITILEPNSLNVFDKSNAIQLYPNPTKSKTTINIKTDKTQEYRIALYEVVGRLIDANVFSGSLNAGVHTLELDLSGKAQGEYLLEIQTELGKKVLPIQKW